MYLRLCLLAAVLFCFGSVLVPKPADADRLLTENVSHPVLVTPDGYRVKSPHFPGVRLHQASIYTRARDYVIQREYTTPFGLVSIEQSKAAPSARPSGSKHRTASFATTGTEVPIEAWGQTPHGADWFLLAAAPNQWLLHMQFPDGTADVWLPVGISATSASAIANGIY